MQADTSYQPWRKRPYHRRWLMDQADALFGFFQNRSFNPRGGFFDLDVTGQPINPDNPVRGIHSTARMVHCFAIGSLLGRPGSDLIVDHGMQFLWNRHRDAQHGGYFWTVDDNGPRDSRKQGYGHAFVLLASSSAKLVGHPLADRMLADVTEILDTRFWEERFGAIAEEFNADWSPIAPYHGQNSNMHLTEALMAAFEATGEQSYLDKAERIAELIIHRRAAENGYRVAEHFDGEWMLDKAYLGDRMFRPPGTTPGHWLEWSRLLLQLWALGGRRIDWMPDAAEALFARAIDIGWDKDKGGFFYNLDWSDQPDMRNKLWWPVSEGVGAAAFLSDHRPSAFHEQWYRNIWDVIARHFLDEEHGGWHEELTEDMRPSHTLFVGKADIYHALQACLIPLYPSTGSLTRALVTEASAKP
ncbi:MAG: N-acylglucosamine 2-epimerase family protein [Devosia sp.]|uniref:AGE family epimerase/isomerase n=1 Tax=Devosia sp. TaxID=1871048 RepID=UPI002621C43E|nr:AGE family epimerase/isomerase [Devosia sp.]MDB5540815.1 N-acylglucosamine 2-epimerase family protein [Devosia sp.]